ncbi:MAG: hypothetical protein AAF355_06235 [Myxococcota bacterium]
MSFWSDASPIVKGAIVGGGVCLVFAFWALLGLPPFSTEAETTQVRGIQPGIEPGAPAAAE